MKILIIDDDQNLANMTSEYLQSKSLEVIVKDNSLNLGNVIQAESIDLCILDVNMPGKSGYDLAEEITTLFPSLHFIFLSGLSQTDDKITGLSKGADDYITKPFSLAELHLRILAILKRRNIQVDKNVVIEKIEIGKYQFKPDYQELIMTDYIIKLTSFETKLLILLVNNQGKIVHRDEILNHIWGDNDFYKNRSLNVYISKQRKYFEKDSSIEIINLHGEGYKLIIKE